jgi:hypothetical protein
LLQILTYAVMDSPPGQAAWLPEKFHSWTTPSPASSRTRYSA